MDRLNIKRDAAVALGTGITLAVFTAPSIVSLIGGVMPLSMTANTFIMAVLSSFIAVGILDAWGVYEL